MNNRFEARARQNRATALVLTFLFHVVLIGGLYYYHLDKKEKAPADTAVKTEQAATAKPVSHKPVHKP